MHFIASTKTSFTLALIKWTFKIVRKLNIYNTERNYSILDWKILSYITMGLSWFLGLIMNLIAVIKENVIFLWLVHNQFNIPKSIAWEIETVMMWECLLVHIWYWLQSKCLDFILTTILKCKMFRFCIDYSLLTFKFNIAYSPKIFRFNIDYCLKVFKSFQVFYYWQSS